MGIASASLPGSDGQRVGETAFGGAAADIGKADPCTAEQDVVEDAFVLQGDRGDRLGEADCSQKQSVRIARLSHICCNSEKSDRQFLGFAGTDPFRLLAALPEARTAMGEESLVVTGKTGADILLAGRTGPGFGNKWGEELQDHRCALARST
jgi:hypothetical protein